MFREQFSFLSLLAFWPTVLLAHGHVSGIVIAGAYYEGYQADSFPYDPNPPLVIGWTTNDKDNGFVAPAAFNTPDIICHRNATPAQGHATAAAGDVISFIWNTWPDSHVGPVFDYLAACHGPCETVDKTKLEWFKIDGASYISGADPGFWAPNVVVSNKFSWKVQLPADLAPGNYVMRHEMIALHAAQSANGAQAYPQCINLQVTGSGKNTYAGLGTLGTQLYKSDDPGIIYNIYQKTMAAYINPGPSVVAGLPTSISQGTPVITATSSASTTYITNVAATSDVASMTLLPTTQAPTTAATSAATPTRTTVAVPTTSAKSTTTAKSTTLKTTTSAAKTTAAAATAKLYAQCGGDSWTGPTDCGTSATCKAMNNYYSQCVPA